MQQPFDTGSQLDERAEVHDAGDLAWHDAAAVATGAAVLSAV